MNFWWKLGLLTTLLIAYTAGVWKVHTWYDNSKLTKVAQLEVTQVETGQNNIVKFNQQIEKVYVKVHDNCLNAPIPDDVKQLLK